MILKFIYPRYSYYIDKLDSQNWFADILDNVNNIFLSSTGYLDKTFYSIDDDDTVFDHTGRRQIIYRLAEVLSNDHMEYILLVREYTEIPTLTKLSPPAFHHHHRPNPLINLPL